MAKKKCGKCGKAGHFAKTCGMSESQRRERRASQKRKKKNSGKPWADRLVAKLEEGTAAITDAEEAATSEPTCDDAFASLPELEPTAGAPEGEATPEGDEDTAPVGGDGKAEPVGGKAEAKSPDEMPDGMPKIDAAELADMLGSMYGELLTKGNEFIALNGGIALGDNFVKVGSWGMTFLVRKYAADMGIDTETAAWGAVGGTGGFTLYQAIMIKRKKDAEAKRAAKPEETKRGNEQQPRAEATNGTTPRTTEPAPDGATALVKQDGRGSGKWA